MLRWDVRLLVACITVLQLVSSKKCVSRNCTDNDRQWKKSDNVNKLSYKNDNDATEKPEDLQKLKRRCCPYEFDGTLCRIVDDRVLCGFNKNVGKVLSRDVVHDLSGGCRLRNGRLECGYLHGPFTNPRRPPGWNDVPQLVSGERNDIEEGDIQKLRSTPKPRLEEFKGQNQKLYTIDDRKCVEIQSRIVCKERK